ncbi:MAG: DUF2339 domain-containing protein [Gemmatimonadota bacterium]
MNADERLDRLEHRLAVLERLVRQILPLVSGKPPLVMPDAEVEEAAPPPPPRPPRPAPRQMPDPFTGAGTTPPRPSSRPARAPRVAEPAPIDSEQWFGQRGLLGVGVVFIILAAGYLLKLSFDRGWISPATRCAGGAIAGIVVGALGWRLNARGLRTYGASLIGAGAAIIYLAVWAASRLYQFFPPTSGIAALALVSLSLAVIAFAIDIEALGTTAALGAFFAPLVLGMVPSNGNALLLYLGCIGISMGWVAANRRWRLTMLVVGLSFFGFASNSSYEQANPYGVLIYALVGGSGGLYIGLREGWWETRILSFGGGWGLLFLANQHLATRWPVLLGAIVLAAPVWWRSLRSPVVLPPIGDVPSDKDALSLGEALYFYLTPFLLAWAVYAQAEHAFDRNPGLLPVIISLPYLLAGFTAVRKPFAQVGTTALLIAALLQWKGLEASWALLALAILWTGTDHLLRRTDGRWYGVLALSAGVLHLVARLSERPGADPAFVGAWPLTLWACAAVFALYAAGLWRKVDDDIQAMGSTALFWSLSGLIVLFGVTGEIYQHYDQSGLSEVTANLARGLVVSAWWMLFSAGLIILGFRRGIKPVRVAGLLVSGMTVLKVVLFDLSTLDALYRVGSVLCLGVVSLGLAYMYNKRARDTR